MKLEVMERVAKTYPERMKIIKFYEGYGEKETVEALGASRKVISQMDEVLFKTRGFWAYNL